MYYGITISVTNLHTEVGLGFAVFLMHTWDTESTPGYGASWEQNHSALWAGELEEKQQSTNCDSHEQSWMTLVAPLALWFIQIHYHVSSTLSLSFFPDEGATERPTGTCWRKPLSTLPPVHGNKINSCPQPSLWKELSKRKVYFHQVLRDCLGQINALRYPLTIPTHLLSVVTHPCSWHSQ